MFSYAQTAETFERLLILACKGGGLDTTEIWTFLGTF